MHPIIGWLWRRKGPSGFSYNSTAEEVTDGINGNGLTAIVTDSLSRRLVIVILLRYLPVLATKGASSGIGVETARVLALRGVHVIMAVRNLSTGSNVKEAIIKEIPNAKVDIIQLDLSSMASVRKFVAEFNARSLPLNILINNAGGWSPSFELTEDEIEQTFATNHIGHFLLTDLLLENMKTTSQKTGVEGRIVIVSSDGYVLTYHEGMRFDKINDRMGYGGFASYGQSKLANIFHAQELSIHLQEQGLNITANAIHPGAIPTNIMRHSSFLNGLFMLAKYVIKSVKQGAATTCYVALNPQVKGVSGEYFSDCNLEKLKSHATNKDMAKKLWDFSMDLIKT